MSEKKVVIVTGANSGIGYEACELFCQEGCDVILACRNQTAASTAMEKLKNLNPDCSVSVLELDLSCLSSVRQFVENFQKTGKLLHVLVNNAGVYYNGNNTRMHTVDGFESTLATNHLGHFLLTNLLLPTIKRTAQSAGEARIVVVSSLLHDTDTAKRIHRINVNPIDFEDLQLEKDKAYTSTQAYKNSKAANIMFMLDLTRRLEGTGVTVNAMCPGFIPATGLMRHTSGFIKCVMRCCLDGCLKPCIKITRKPSEGGHDIFMLGLDGQFRGISGKFYKSGIEADPSIEVQDQIKQKEMWEMSEKLTAISEEI